ncbi:MAG: hypothetical protein K0U68_00980 [Gammaproteobacteria bacterium]|nr:hypothetical protein [Gammaproteobacteria bacterium]
MSTISGIFNRNEKPADIQTLKRMMNATVMARVDSRNTVSHGSIALGSLISFFTEEDHFETQPLESSNGDLLLVADVRLNNRSILKNKLNFSAQPLNSIPDSEFILHSYLKWGRDCPLHLEGDFAFAIWDKTQKTLFCARDAFGLRPFYYQLSLKQFVFSSSLNGVLANSEVDTRLNEQQMAHFLLGPIRTADTTFYKDILRLPSAHRIWIDNDRVEIDRYWEPSDQDCIRLSSENDYVDAFKECFNNAVCACMRADRSIIVSLSGGLDSSSVTTVAASHLEALGKRLPTITTFSENNLKKPPRNKDPDERSYVKSLQQYIDNIDCHFIEIFDPKPNWQDLERSFEILAEPHLQSFSTHRGQFTLDLMEELDIRVLLNGLGGNLFVSPGLFGYPAMLARQGRWVKLVQEVVGRKNIYGDSLTSILKSHLIWPFLPQLLQKHHKTSKSFTAINPALIDDLEKNKYFNLPSKTAISILARDYNKAAIYKHKRNGMQSAAEFSAAWGNATGISGRSPMNNRELNAFCMAVPPDQMINNGWDRLLLRKAMQGKLAPDIQWRISRGIAKPELLSWFEAMRPAFQNELLLLEKLPMAQHFLNLPTIRHLLSEPSSELTRQKANICKMAMIAGRFMRRLD